MTDSLQPTTEIDAVNAMIATIGLAPTTSLDVDDVDVQQALDKLKDVSRQVQSAGWDFNSEKNYPLAPDVDGNITIPTNIVSVKFKRECKWQYDPVVRAGKVYNRKAKTFTFTSPLKATVVFLFDFEDLPQEARSYIAVRAARVFQDNAEGLADGHTFTQQDEQTAWIALQNYEADTADYTYSTRLHPSE